MRQRARIFSPPMMCTPEKGYDCEHREGGPALCIRSSLDLQSERLPSGRRFQPGHLVAVGTTIAGRPTGWPKAVARLRLPQNVACGFPALRSSEVASQHGDSL